MRSFLIIQTAFIGDVILSTALVEKLKTFYPQSSIDFLLRKGNESLLKGHPHIRQVLIWNKQKQKVKNFLSLLSTIRRQQYDCVINIHRFISSGLFTVLSGAPVTIGFSKNPMAFFYTHQIRHRQMDAVETERNQQLIASLTDPFPAKPRLYPDQPAYSRIKPYQDRPYLCIAPTSVWFTKQWPSKKWINLMDELKNKPYMIYLIGSLNDHAYCHALTKGRTSFVVNLAGQLSLLESAALIQGAAMTYVNDSAPLHIASAMNAPTTAIFCSTIPAFGFTPLSDQADIVETTETLNCRPCGLHGKKKCPQEHFRCAFSISTQRVLQSLPAS